MNVYQQRLEEDVEDITQRVMEVSYMVDSALKDAVHALLTCNHSLAYETILGDHRINREVQEIDRRCHYFVARHLPSAKHLRMVSAILRIARELERMGDYAATIGRETAQLKAEPPRNVARAIELLAEQSRGMLRQTFKAFRDRNAERARGTMVIERSIDSTFDKVLQDLLEEEGEASLKDLMGLMVVLNRLERVSDRAKNVCVEIIFWLTGEGKAPKNFKILFLDRRNACLSQLAEAIARKAYPEKARFFSAGLEPAESLSPHVAKFVEERGLDLSLHKPEAFDPAPEMVSDYHVVVGLGLEPEEHIPEVPFHTALLSWDVGECPQTPEQVEEVHRNLLLQIRELMEILHGEDAS